MESTRRRRQLQQVKETEDKLRVRAEKAASMMKTLEEYDDDKEEYIGKDDFFRDR